MRVYVDCLVNGFTRGSDSFYRGNWDEVEAAVATVKERLRGNASVSAQRPGLLRIILVDERTDDFSVLVDAIASVSILIDEVARIVTVELEP